MIILQLSDQEKLIYQRLNIEPQKLKNFCQKNHISELAVFGSILRDDFNNQSDIDFLVTYSPLANRGLLEKIALKEKLEIIFQRPVDLVSKNSIKNSKNWLMKQEILNSYQVIYNA